MLRRSLFILVLLSGCALLPLYSQSILVPVKTLKEIQNLNWSLQSQIEYVENELQKAQEQLETSKEATKELKNIISQLSKDLETLEKLQNESIKSLQASSLKKQIKTGFIVGGVCIVVTAAIAVPVTIYLYDKYFKN